MPLRDHFADRKRTWQPVHGGWPMVIVQHLTRVLPPQYQAHPRIQLGPYFEIDIGAIDTAAGDGLAEWRGAGGTATLAKPAPTMTAERTLEELPEYEINVTDLETDTLVAAIELVSPANKDRPESRWEFVAKCGTLLNQGVCVSIVDLVSCRDFNLYAELLEELGHADPAMPADPPSLYAATAREHRLNPRGSRFESWFHPMRIGAALPTLPIWLGPEEWVPLDLEATYEETCHTLRLA